LNYIQNFGFFEKTGIDLPEIFSENKELKSGREVNFATASFGQGIAVTPIQLIKAYSAIANGGTLVTPYLVENLKKSNETKKILSQKTTTQLTSMLVSVIEKGSGRRAKIPGYYIGGKTGTASQPKVGEKGYSEKTWQSFIGFFPAYNPKFLILVKLDNPKTKTAEVSAVPIFHDLADYIIKVYQIPPDYE
jgi:cell division protein FtsI (penicillin-binding protein 3)/stage V sporulation protein D (sporulation-specific penicillin-binding protein)